MTPSAPPVSRRPGSVLCLGEALVDLICERPVRSVAEADTFVPRFGGAAANVAVTAARLGAPVLLAGGAGDDRWGEWLRARLNAEGVDTTLFSLVPAAQTPLALVTLDEGGEASYSIYGEGIATVVHALGDRLEAAVGAAGGLFFGSNTLVGAEEREVTMRARELALAAEKPVVFDPNFRLHRWRSAADAAATANSCVPGSLLVRCNLAEAELMTGESDPERAASALVKGGARLALITLGAEGALLRGELRAEVAGVPAQVRSTVGAGDVFTGVILARLALSGWYRPSIAASLPEAALQAARACERFSALA